MEREEEEHDAMPTRHRAAAAADNHDTCNSDVVRRKTVLSQPRQAKLYRLHQACTALTRHDVSIFSFELNTPTALQLVSMCHLDPRTRKIKI